MTYYYYSANYPGTEDIAFFSNDLHVAIGILHSITIEDNLEKYFCVIEPDITEKDIKRVMELEIYSSGILNNEQIRNLRDWGTIILEKPKRTLIQEN